MTGRCYAQLGQTAKAEVAYRKAGDLNSDNPLINRFLNEDSDAL
jgi:Flp pilus assembly protein TadD